MKNKIKKVAIIANLQKKNALPVSRKLIELLDRQKIKILTEENLAKKLNLKAYTYSQIAKEAEIVFSLGGDGTLLSTTRFLNFPANTPIFGINLGTGLGFLTESCHTDINKSIDCLISGDYEITKRHVLCVTKDHPKKEIHYALNDITITRDQLSRVFDFDVKIDNIALTTYKSDGIIVATPTGSTAYSLSAGGSIVDPETKALLITPICPHTLTNRPLIIPDKKTIQIDISAFDGIIMTIDGQTGIPITNKTGQINIKLSRKNIQLVKLPHNNFCNILRKKLNWSGTSSL